MGKGVFDNLQCPICGSTELRIAIHTVYEYSQGHVGNIVTNKENNLTPDDMTVCNHCDYSDKLFVFEMMRGK